MEEMKVLFEKAEALIHQNPDVQQMIVVMTQKGNVYHFANTDAMNSADEENFLSMLREKDDIQISKMVCMWNNFAVDLPHIRFRKRLVELCPENAEAYILLMGEGHYVAHRLSKTMPAK